jgi:protein involved in polysaccharide export with SLBB domain
VLDTFRFKRAGVSIPYMKIQLLLALAVLCPAAHLSAQSAADLIKAGDTLKITAVEPGTHFVGDRAYIFNRIPGTNTLLFPAVKEIFAINTTMVVRADGKISLPLLDNVPADGLTVAELRQIIAGRVGKYLNKPDVTVTLVR